MSHTKKKNCKKRGVKNMLLKLLFFQSSVFFFFLTRPVWSDEFSKIISKLRYDGIIVNILCYVESTVRPHMCSTTFFFSFSCSLFISQRTKVFLFILFFFIKKVFLLLLPFSFLFSLFVSFLLQKLGFCS